MPNIAPIVGRFSSAGRNIDPVAEAIVRLEEILETDYPAHFERFEEDIKALAHALLLLLRRPEEQVLEQRHFVPVGNICLRCGRTVEKDSPSLCPGVGL